MMGRVPVWALGADVVEALARAKTTFREACDTLRRYEGRELINSQVGRRGAYFVEFPVGEARLGDPRGEAGSRRLIMLIQSKRVAEVYFTDDHYRPHSWSRIE